MELGRQSVGVRLVAGQPPNTTDGWHEAQYFLGRDFGYANTITLSVVRSPTPVDLDAVQARYDALKDEAEVRAFLETHAVPPDVEVIAQRRFDGRAFLDRINKHSEHIESLTSRIDIAYNALKAIADQIRQDLKLEPSDRITPEMKARHPQARAFFAKFGLINDLKRARRARYRKIAAIKKCWFGYLSNIEIQMAKDYHAAIVREDLTVTAIEKDAPEYRGRAFNRMINHGAKGQYQRMAKDKCLWNGVPEIPVPSWYSSRYCGEHSTIVEKRYRKGEQILFPCCGQTFHADEHAAFTLGCYPFLRPIAFVPGPVPGCDTRSNPPSRVERSPGL